MASLEPSEEKSTPQQTDTLQPLTPTGTVDRNPAPTNKRRPGIGAIIVSILLVILIGAQLFLAYFWAGVYIGSNGLRDGIGLGIIPLFLLIIFPSITLSVWGILASTLLARQPSPLRILVAISSIISFPLISPLIGKVPIVGPFLFASVIADRDFLDSLPPLPTIRPQSEEPPTPTPLPSLLDIKNTGGGYAEITIFADGSGKAAGYQTDALLTVSQPNKEVGAGTIDLTALQSDLTTIGNVGFIPTTPCAAYPGGEYTSESITYMGTLSSDITCLPANVANPVYAKLKTDISKAEAIIIAGKEY